jgi:hypothetical protein
MPKRGGAGTAAATAGPAEEPPADLDLSSDEEVAPDDPGADSEPDSEPGSAHSDEEELQEALAEYMKAAAEGRPADAVGDDEEAGPSGEDHLRWVPAAAAECTAPHGATRLTAGVRTHSPPPPLQA